MHMNAVAIIPTLNEEMAIGEVLKKTLKHVDAVVVVDSSIDKTPEICKASGKKVILICCERFGKGYAVRLGIKRALKENPKYLVFLDGDGEKDPDCIPSLLNELASYDFVVGKRNRMRSFRRQLLNTFSNFWFRLATNYDVKDMTSGFFALKAEAIRKLNLTSMRFEIETEMVLEAFRNDLTIKEIPVNVPEISKSKLNARHMLEINEFFDRWVLRNLHIQKSLLKKLFLPIFCITGMIVSYFFRIFL